jgi:hypothetical protein
MEWCLNEAKKLFGIRHIGHSHFAVWRKHFQTVTIRHGFISFFHKRSVSAFV